jgi:hypothetical protein
MDGVDQLVDGQQTFFFRDVGHMSIAGRCIGIGMTEKGLDMTEAQTLFKQMGGKTVAKRMDGNLFFYCPMIRMWTRLRAASMSPT